MSRITSLKLDAQIGEVVATLGLMPAALKGAIRERMYDLLSHHRLSVIKHHRLPGRKARAFVASRLFRYTREARSAFAFDAAGEGFAAAVKGETYGERVFRALEEGGTIRSDEPMFIPSAAAIAMRGRKGGMAAILKDLDVINTPRAKGLLVHTAKGGRGKGLRSIVYGWLRRQRRQRPLLGYFRQWDLAVSRHTTRFGADVDRAMTEAGRLALSERSKSLTLGREVFAREFQRYLAAHPGRFGPARKAAAAATAAVRRSALAPRGRRA